MTQNQAFDFAGPAGRLEAILMWPDEAPLAAAVVCHAHPQFGGIMHYKVVFRIAKALQQEGLAALRFNFRGVGRSEGTHDQGRGEQDDVRAALDESERRFPGLPLLLGGFSFGSEMALRVGVGDARARALFALGFPLSRVGDTSFLEFCSKPRLFVQGEADEFGPADQLRRLVERLPPPRSLVVVPGSDHFFTGHLEALQIAVASWAGGRPWEGSSRPEKESRS
ncbi:MAG TPA: alpha/beta fold hydrolase [Vicinamibacteria bacterium]|nr:alpha/beta fold hydrolase [Vicinamibacteria bacterium]